MEAPTEHTSEEIKGLQRCIADLVSVLSLPAIWTGGEPARIIGTFLDVLLGMLQLDFVYARLNDPAGGAPIEMIRLSDSRKLAASSQEIESLLRDWLKDDPQHWPAAERKPIGDGEISLIPLRLGLQGDLGFVVAGSERADFPGQSERLLLTVAANQAAIALQEAQLRNAQKRLAKELDQRVEQRTIELARTNEELKMEVAERKRTAEALREEEKSFRLILDGIAGLVAIMTSAGQIQLVNRQVLDYFGFTVEHLEHWATNDAVHPADLQSVISAWTHSIQTGSPYDIDHRLRRADGEYRWFHARGLPLLATDGNILRWYVLLTDIDDRRRAEEALKRSEAFLAEGQHLSRTGSFSWRVATDEIKWSDEMYRIFEFEQGSPVTLERIRTRIHPEDIPSLDALIDRVREQGSNFEFEHRLQLPDQSVKHLHMVAHATRDPEGRMEFIGAVQDVTQRRTSEAELSKAHSELTRVARATTLGMMTASIAHEVNQPLSGIVTNASTCLRMLSSDPPNIDGARETARRTIRDGNRASEVINRLRALFSKKETAAESVDLNDATREVVALLLTDLQRTRAIPQLELAEDLPLVTGDRVQLQQVIMNLIRNAADAMSAVDDRPRRLTIRTELDDGGRVRLTVRDEGVGLVPEMIDKLFDAFYTTKNDGMGIGLSVSRSIIENHQGRLWAAPNNGPGATFSFSIPRRTDNSTGAHGIRDVRARAATDAN
jgi:PAS domain S-box-containing protein